MKKRFDFTKSPCCGERIVFPAELATCSKCGTRLKQTFHEITESPYDRHARELSAESIIGLPRGPRRPLEMP